MLPCQRRHRAARRDQWGRTAGRRILASGRKLIAQRSYIQNLKPALADAILQQQFLLVDGSDWTRQAVRVLTGTVLVQNSGNQPYRIKGAMRLVDKDGTIAGPHAEV